MESSAINHNFSTYDLFFHYSETVHFIFLRCFALVDNSVVLQTTQQDNLLVENMDTQEGLMGMGLASTLHTVLMQSSEKIFKVYNLLSLQQSIRFLCSSGL